MRETNTVLKGYIPLRPPRAKDCSCGLDGRGQNYNRQPFSLRFTMVPDGKDPLRRHKHLNKIKKDDLAGSSLGMVFSWLPTCLADTVKENIRSAGPGSPLTRRFPPRAAGSALTPTSLFLPTFPRGHDTVCLRPTAAPTSPQGQRQLSWPQPRCRRQTRPVLRPG